MPKRDRSIPGSPYGLGSPTRALGNLVRWGSSKAFNVKPQSLTVDISAAPEESFYGVAPTTPLTKAMRTRRMSQQMHIEDISTAFARQAPLGRETGGGGALKVAIALPPSVLLKIVPARL